MIGTQAPVLDKGFVELQDLMGNDLAIVNAARVSFLGESKGDEADKKLLHYLMKHAHTSPLEQAEFKFRIKAPVVVWWQLVRHRMASINMQSGRYTEFDEDDFYIPTEWRKQAASNKQASDGLVSADYQSGLTSALSNHIDNSYALYFYALQIGVAREQARLFLPAWCSYYTGVWKIDAHNLLHFLKLRMAQEAQYEIRQYAVAIWRDFFKPSLPWTAEAAIQLWGMDE